MRLRLLDLMCPQCGYHEERSVDLNEIGDDKKNLVVLCPSCGESDMEEVWIKAPMGRVGGENSERSIASMKQSFKERFVKKEQDSVRHKHGKLYDDAARSAAAQRIKKHEESK